MGIYCNEVDPRMNIYKRKRKMGVYIILLSIMQVCFTATGLKSNNIKEMGKNNIINARVCDEFNAHAIDAPHDV